MKKVFINQSNYIPWKGYFDAVNMADVFVIYDDVQYTKRDWRNRNRIKTKDGVLWLSIPVSVTGKFDQLIQETKIVDMNWSSRHWSTLQQAYSSATGFGYYRERIESIYREAKSTFLSEINFLFISQLCEILGIDTEIRFSTEFPKVSDPSERLLEICKCLGATVYLTGPAAKNYLNEDLFFKEGISIEYIDYQGYPEYSQLHGEFVHEVSILDLLFNAGKDHHKYLIRR